MSPSPHFQSYLMVIPLIPEVRYPGIELTEEHRRPGCYGSLGVDQGFHNWLLYSGQLAKYLDVKIFQQGEGPVNTLGGFFGANNKKLMGLSLTEMKILQGAAPHKKVYNWNGDVSPIVHQYDRFL